MICFLKAFIFSSLYFIPKSIQNENLPYSMQSQGIFLIKAVCRITENDLSFSDYLKKQQKAKIFGIFCMPKKRSRLKAKTFIFNIAYSVDKKRSRTFEDKKEKQHSNAKKRMTTKATPEKRRSYTEFSESLKKKNI